MKKRKSKIENRKSEVWHIYRFIERFELPEDMRMLRKSGLHYTRDFVGTAGGDEAVGYHTSFNLIANGDGLEYSMLYGLYRRLVNLAAQHSRIKRGYLLDVDNSPLSAVQIGKILGINGNKMRFLLQRFAKVKLLELIDTPDFSELSSDDEQAPAQPEKSKSKTVKHERTGQKRRKTTRACNAPGNSGEKQSPLKKRQGKGKALSSKELKATNGKTANASKKNKKRAKQLPAQEEAQTRHEQPQAEPHEPQRADAAGTGRTIRINPPGPSHLPAHSPPAGSYVPTYSQADVMFGTRVYQALGYQFPIHSTEGIREITAFASKWNSVLARLTGVPPPEIDALGMRLLREARKIGSRKANRNPGAVFQTVVERIVNKHTKTETG